MAYAFANTFCAFASYIQSCSQVLGFTIKAYFQTVVNNLKKTPIAISEKHLIR